MADEGPPKKKGRKASVPSAPEVSPAQAGEAEAAPTLEEPEDSKVAVADAAANASASADADDDAEPQNLAGTFARLFGGSSEDAPVGLNTLFASSASAMAPSRSRATEAAPEVKAAAAAAERAAARAAAQAAREQAAEAKAAKQRKFTPEEKKAREARTVFIGNVPLDWDQKRLRRVLRDAIGDKYTGSIRPIWFEGEPPSRWAGKPTKVYSDAKYAYAVVESPADVLTVRQAAHGLMADARHKLRVDGMGEGAKLRIFGRKRSVFVGNLPPNVSEADLREVFEKAGEVDAVRVVRAKATHQCTGVAFVLFQERASVKAALQLWGKSIKGREIRVTMVEQRETTAGDEDHPAQVRIRERKQRARGATPGWSDASWTGGSWSGTSWSGSSWKQGQGDSGAPKKRRKHNKAPAKETFAKAKKEKKAAKKAKALKPKKLRSFERKMVAKRKD